METFFDLVAYRLLGRVAEYTPQRHYELREQMAVSLPHVLLHSRLRFPYWFALVLFRLTDLYWLVRDCGQK